MRRFSKSMLSALAPSVVECIEEVPGYAPLAPESSVELANGEAVGAGNLCGILPTLGLTEDSAKLRCLTPGSP